MLVRLVHVHTCECVCVHDHSDSLHPTATESPGAREAALLKVHPGRFFWIANNYRRQGYSKRVQRWAVRYPCVHVS